MYICDSTWYICGNIRSQIRVCVWNIEQKYWLLSMPPGYVPYGGPSDVCCFIKTISPSRLLSGWAQLSPLALCLICVSYFGCLRFSTLPLMLCTSYVTKMIHRTWCFVQSVVFLLCARNGKFYTWHLPSTPLSICVTQISLFTLGV